jgi:hypothetical protein
MKLALLFSLVLATTAAVAEDAPPQAPHAEQQICMTWLALMAQFGEPADSREGWTKILTRLMKAVDARTDKETDAAKAEAKEAIGVYNEWVMTYHTGPVEERVRMIVDMTGKAKACVSIVPPEETPGETEPPEGDGELEIDTEL